MTPTIKSMKAYVPAKDIDISKKFYRSLGFNMRPAFGGTLDCELGGYEFRLQDYYVQDWANNFMIVMSVDDVGEWHRKALEIQGFDIFRDVRVKDPEMVDNRYKVLHVVDPSGVLLVFVQDNGI